MTQSSQISFSASVTAPSFGVQASFTGSLDTAVSEEQQSEFEQSTTRSNVLIYLKFMCFFTFFFNLS